MRPSHRLPTVAVSCRAQTYQRSVTSMLRRAWSPSAPGAGTRSSCIATENRECACSASAVAHTSSPMDRSDADWRFFRARAPRQGTTPWATHAAESPAPLRPVRSAGAPPPRGMFPSHSGPRAERASRQDRPIALQAPRSVGDVPLDPFQRYRSSTRASTAGGILAQHPRVLPISVAVSLSRCGRVLARPLTPFTVQPPLIVILPQHPHEHRPERALDANAASAPS